MEDPVFQFMGVLAKVRPAALYIPWQTSKLKPYWINMVKILN